MGLGTGLGLTVERYQPMLRLLDRSDWEFLARQPGFSRRQAERFRRQRLLVFQGYLTDLSRDFRAACSALQSIMLQAGNDRPDLAKALVRAQAAFTRGMLSVRLHLFLYRMGWAGVDASGLVGLLDFVQIELHGLASAMA